MTMFGNQYEVACEGGECDKCIEFVDRLYKIHESDTSGAWCKDCCIESYGKYRMNKNGN